MKRSPCPGFTLIELMIVVAIMAVIAAIAIPNMISSKISSNETAAIAGLRTYVSAQSQFYRTDFYEQGVLEYANDVAGEGFPDLYRLGGPEGSGAILKMIDIRLARAVPGGPPRNGFVFDDIEYGDYGVDCGLGSAPKEYGRSGRNLFVVDITGTVYQSQASDSDNDSPPTIYPDVGSGWIPVGSEG